MPAPGAEETPGAGEGFGVIQALAVTLPCRGERCPRASSRRLGSESRSPPEATRASLAAPPPVVP